jgi:hypothetical protein
LLRTQGKRPDCRSAAKYRDEFAPSQAFFQKAHICKAF